MSRVTRARGAALAVLGVLALPAFGDTETLQDAWQRALEYDHALAAAAANAESARASERAARGARWPSLNVNGGFTRFATAPQFQFAAPGFAIKAPIVPGDNLTSGGVQLKLPLYTGGRISAGIGAAHQAAISASRAEQVARSTTRLDIAERCVAVLRAQRFRQTAESMVASLRAHVRDVRNMVERDLVSRSDLLAANVALANAEEQRVRAENGLALAYAAYNRRLGESLDRTPDLVASLPVDPQLPDQPLESLLRRARESRSELSALTAHADALALQAKAERAELLPQIALTGEYSYFDNVILDRRDFSSVGIGLTWNLFDGGQARNRSAALRSASRAARRQADDLRTQIELQVREAWLNVREARARVAASSDAVAQAEENLRVTRELYGAGLGTNTQVLDAVALYVSAANNRDNAALDESLALLGLARAVGAL